MSSAFVGRPFHWKARFSSSLPNDEAIIVQRAYAAPLARRSRLTVGALMIETNDKWAVARRYMELESLARIRNTDDYRPRAMTA